MARTYWLNKKSLTQSYNLVLSAHNCDFQKRTNLICGSDGKESACNAGAAATAKSLQSCPTLCNPIDGCPPDSSIPGFLQVRILEWVAVSFSNAWQWKVKVKSFSHVRLFSTPWTVAYQAPLSMGSSRQEYWSGVPFPFPAMRETWVPSLGPEDPPEKGLVTCSSILARKIPWTEKPRWL